MQREEFVGVLDRLLAVEEFTDYCPIGLQIEGKSEVKKVGFAVSATLNVIKEAKERGVDLLVVHHGLFWNKDPYPIVGMKKNRISALMEADISLVAYHLPLDAHQGLGNNWKAARDMGWQNLESFAKLGVKGSFAPVSASEFQKQIENYYGRQAHVAPAKKEKVSSVALVSGGAHRMLEQAAAAGVDCFITGSFDEMNWEMAKELDVHFFALGHHVTERVGPLALKEHVEKQMGLDCVWIDHFNPF